MPYVNIQLIEGTTPEQRAAVMRGVTEVISKTLNKRPEATYVVIEEVSLDNWAIGGETMRERRKK